MSSNEALTQQEKLNFVKFSRYNEVASDKIASVLLDLTEKLESIGFISEKRQSKQNRDKKLRSILLQHRQSNMDILEMMNYIPAHPDSEKLVNSLFQVLNVPRYIPRKTFDRSPFLNSSQQTSSVNKAESNNAATLAQIIQKSQLLQEQQEKRNQEIQQLLRIAQQAQQQAQQQLQTRSQQSQIQKTQPEQTQQQSQPAQTQQQSQPVQTQQQSQPAQAQQQSQPVQTQQQSQPVQAQQQSQPVQTQQQSQL